MIHVAVPDFGTMAFIERRINPPRSFLSEPSTDSNSCYATLRLMMAKYIQNRRDWSFE